MNQADTALIEVLDAKMAVLQKHGVRRYRFADGAEVEFAPAEAPRPKGKFDGSDSGGMPTREEMFELKTQIDAADKVGPQKG